MAKTKTTQRSTLTTWQDVDNSLREIAEASTTVKKSEAEMNRLTLEIQNRFEQETRETRDKIIAHEKQIELFCIEHRDEFVASKTKELNFGLVSFRMSPPKLTLLRGFTWESVLGLLKKLDMLQFVRTKEEVDRDAIKEQLSEANELAQIGLHLDQKEHFYYEAYEKEFTQ